MAKEITYGEAGLNTIQEEMRRNPKIFIIGQDNVAGFTRGAGGAWEKAMVEEFGRNRFRWSPISEEAQAGVGIGAALMGMRPIIDLWYSDFVIEAFGQIVNQAARLRFKLANTVDLPVVYRVDMYGGNSGIHHSNCYYNMFANAPGVLLAIPSTPADSVGLWRTALRDSKNPVMIWEHALIRRVKGTVPEEDYTIPFGKGDIKREGRDITIAAIGQMVYLALEAAEDLSKQGINAEVWDPRTLTPFDREGLLKSVRKTGSLVIVDQAPKSFGTSGEFAITVAEAMDPVPPMMRVTLMDASVAASAPLAKYILPNKDKVIKAVKDVLTRKKS